MSNVKKQHLHSVPTFRQDNRLSVAESISINPHNIPTATEVTVQHGLHARSCGPHEALFIVGRFSKSALYRLLVITAG